MNKDRPLVNIPNAREGDQVERMKLSEEVKLCIFCENGLKEIHKLPILKENRSFLVTDSAFPYKGTLHHVLIIPKAHVSNIAEIDSVGWVDLKEMIDWVIAERNIEGGSLFIRFGDSTLNCGSLQHLHVHVIVGESSQYDTGDKVEKLKVSLGWKRVTE